MKTEKLSSDQTTKLKPRERRQLIRDAVESNGKLLYEDLLKQLGISSLARQSLKDDLEAINNLGSRLALVHDKNQKWLVDQKNAHWSTVNERSLSQLREKQLIASFCTGLVCGFASDADTPSSVNKGPFGCCSAKQIIHLLKTQNQISHSSPSVTEKVLEIERMLQTWWHQMNRLVALDAGTTTLETAKALVNLKLPNNQNNLISLTVCTNSRQIYETLGAPSVDAKIIIIGGSHVDRSNAIAGHLALEFLSAAKTLRFGIAIVGSSLIDIKEMECNAPSWDEAQLKGCLLSKAALKVVVADNTKITRHQLRSSHPFASISGKSGHVDLIVTNHPLKNSNRDIRQAQVEGDREFDEMISRIRENGIPVVVMPPPSKGDK